MTLLYRRLLEIVASTTQTLVSTGSLNITGNFLANSVWEKGGILARNLRRCHHLLINLFGPQKKKNCELGISLWNGFITRYLRDIYLMHTWQLREDLSISLLKGHEILFCWGTWASLLLKDMKFWDRSWTKTQCSCCTLSFFFWVPNILNGAKRASITRQIWTKLATLLSQRGERVTMQIWTKLATLLSQRGKHH